MGTTRRISREIALQVLYQMEFDIDLSPQQGLKLFEDHFEIEQPQRDYCKKLVGGVREFKPQIDELIQKHSHNWKLHRISFVDRNILRISIFEMLKLQDEVPKKASINEAIEIAKKFGTQDSSQFINGILDQISKDI